MEPVRSITLEEIEAAQSRLAGGIVRTPLIRLNLDDTPAEIYLKLENLQPIGSFKLRGAGNAILQTPSELIAEGVWTASAGNMAQGVAWWARYLGVPCTAVVPDNAPETKLEAIRRLGATAVKVPFEEWWHTMELHDRPGMRGRFIHPFADPAVIAGNGTVGLEILEDLPDVDAVLIPFGGGGLSCGVASAIRARKPGTRVYACEVEFAAPLAASLAAGKAVALDDYRKNFADGISGPSLNPEMWPLASSLFDGSLVMPVAEIAAAVKLLMERNRIVAEGAGATALAAALSGKAGTGKIVCVISGGNIDAGKLVKILNGEVPA
ncbi:MAG TPA: pyridoxal-phosphate dependent enzyme [Thermomicrobiaceae bacterium]|nr:pyridoxal-phosphate dependent enzyme [Thermomicrobiaceae bacterium]